jgi:hypothetical protein
MIYALRERAVEIYLSFPFQTGCFFYELSCAAINTKGALPRETSPAHVIHSPQITISAHLYHRKASVALSSVDDSSDDAVFLRNEKIFLGLVFF